MNGIMFKRVFMRKLLLLVVPLAGILAVSGCSNPSSSSQDPVVGTWNLTSITVSGVPTPLNAFGVTSFVLTISANNTWSGVEVPFPVAAATNSSGTWSLSGSTYTVIQTAPSPGTFTATVSGNTITYTSSPVVETLTKQ
jgi:hypothetical protein